MAEELKDKTFEVIFISELRRTKQTADIVNMYHGVPLITDTRLNDHHSGFEGKSHAEYNKLYEAAKDKWNARFNDSELFKDVRFRVQDFLTELKTKSYDYILW